MKNKQLLALATEALQLKDELFGLESIRDDEKKKEHDKLTVSEPSDDRLAQFLWQHAKEQCIHDAKETKLGNFNIPAYNFFKSVKALHAKFIVLQRRAASLKTENNDEFNYTFRQLAHNITAIENRFLSIDEVAMIASCYRPIKLTLNDVELALTETRGFADNFNKNPSMASYRKLCSNRDFFATNAEYLAYEINALRRDIARNPKPEPAHVESARALDKVLDSVKKDLASLDKDIDNLRYQHSAVLYHALDEVNADSYEGSIFTYLQFYWLITLSYLHSAFIGIGPIAMDAESSQDLPTTTAEFLAEEDYVVTATIH